MFKRMKTENKNWAKRVREHDLSKLERGLTTKKPRRVKTQPDDAFDALNLTLDEASEVTGNNIIHARIHWRQYRNCRTTVVDSVEVNKRNDVIVIV